MKEANFFTILDMKGLEKSHSLFICIQSKRICDVQLKNDNGMCLEEA